MITAVLLLVCVVAELGILFAFGVSGLSTKLTSDEATYDRLAVNLLEHSQFSAMSEQPLEPAIHRSPGYPFFLLVIYWIGGHSEIPALIVQFVLLAATGWVLFLLAQHFVSVGSAIIAGVLCVAYPQLMFMATYRLTEVISTFLATLIILSLVRYAPETKYRTTIAFVIGGIIGAASLVRPSFLLFIGFALITVVWRWWNKGIKQLAKQSLVLITGFSIFIVPWVVRDYFVTGKIVPLTVDSGFSLYVSALQYTGELNSQLTGDDWEKILSENNSRRERAKSLPIPDQTPPSVYQEMRINQDYRVETLQMIQSQSIFRMLLKTPGRILALWSVGDQLLRKFHKITYIFFSAITLLTIAGVFLSRKSLLAQGCLWLFPIYLSLLHLVFHVETRYSFPARPFLLVYAGVAITWLANFARMRTLK